MKRHGAQLSLTMPAILMALLLLPVVPAARAQSVTVTDEQARRLLSEIGQSIGGGEGAKVPASLVMSGRFTQFSGTSAANSDARSEIRGEIRIELLAPDRFLRTEIANPQPQTFVSLYQGFDGKEAWIDRKVNRTLGDDGSAEANRGLNGQNSPVAVRSRGMRDVTSGTVINRTETPGNIATERTVLGMPIPQPQGPEVSQSPGAIRETGQVAARKSPGPPGIDNPDVKKALTRRLLRDFACLSLIWLQQTPTPFPVRLSHAGSVQSGGEQIEALEITGPDDFAGRLFVSQSTHRPVLLTYRELTARSVGYLTSASPNEPNLPANLEEAAIQLHLGDYRLVKGPKNLSLWLPFHILRAINGRTIEEWRVEKYRLNSDLGEKRFQH